MNESVELVGVGDSSHEQRLGDTDERPESSSVDLSSDVVRNSKRFVRPSSRDCRDSSARAARRERERLTLTSDETIKRNSFRDEKFGASLELDEELRSVVGVDVDLVAVFSLESIGVLLCCLDGLEIVLEFDFLSISFLLGIVTTEEIRFCRGVRQQGSQRRMEETYR